MSFATKAKQSYPIYKKNNKCLYASEKTTIHSTNFDRFWHFASSHFSRYALIEYSKWFEVFSTSWQSFERNYVHIWNVFLCWNIGLVFFFSLNSLCLKKTIDLFTKTINVWNISSIRTNLTKRIQSCLFYRDIWIFGFSTNRLNNSFNQLKFILISIRIFTPTPRFKNSDEMFFNVFPVR